MLEKLQAIIRWYADDEEIVISENMVLLTDLGLSSFELIELICEIEEKFEVEIPDRVISSLETVRDVIDYIVVKGTGV